MLKIPDRPVSNREMFASLTFEVNNEDVHEYSGRETEGGSHRTELITCGSKREEQRRRSTVKMVPGGCMGGHERDRITAATKAAPERNSSTEKQLQAQKEQKAKEHYIKEVIGCMKQALRSSISHIAMRGKERTLNPEKDFTIKTKMNFDRVASQNSDAVESTAHNNKLQHNQNKLSSSLPQEEHTSARETPLVPAQRPNTGGDNQNQHLSASSMDKLKDTGCVTSFDFTDYSPMCYQHLRQFFAIEAETFQQVLCTSKWHWVPTAGKSAAELFFCGSQWVIKTMTQEESDFLRKILHRYYYHVRDNPYTLLPHFVGHHSINVNYSNSHASVEDNTIQPAKRKIIFVIMQNVFATTNTIHEKFDLKGSTVGRFATPLERKKVTCTKKDLDLNHPLLLGPQRSHVMISQLKRDCDFLKKAEIMDYSFLIGIHYPDAATLLELASAAKERHLNHLKKLHRQFHMRSPPPPGKVHSPTRESSRKFSTFDASSSVPLTPVGAPTGSVGAPHRGAPSLGGYAAVNSALGGNGIVPVDGRCFTADQGGMLTYLHPGRSPAVYYVGIIDILQEYNTWKASETFLCGVVHDRKHISSVNSKEYAQRFLKFISFICDHSE